MPSDIPVKCEHPDRDASDLLVRVIPQRDYVGLRLEEHPMSEVVDQTVQLLRRNLAVSKCCQLGPEECVIPHDCMLRCCLCGLCLCLIYGTLICVTQLFGGFKALSSSRSCSSEWLIVGEARWEEARLDVQVDVSAC